MRIRISSQTSRHGHSRLVWPRQTRPRGRCVVWINIENVRCFQGKYDVPLAPLTLLVGENSTGKSTFLAIISAMTGKKGFPISTEFNAPPYDLGGYDTIAA